MFPWFNVTLTSLNKKTEEYKQQCHFIVAGNIKSYFRKSEVKVRKKKIKREKIKYNVHHIIRGRILC